MMKCAETGPRGRTAAGQDPAKRDQILDGAKRCFLRLGFENASMNEITAEAGVSKGTIYVYFQNKEELFIELIERERSVLLEMAEYELNDGYTLDEALHRFCMSLATQMSSDEVVRAQRIVLGVAERMPEVAERFFGPEPFSGVLILQRYFDRKIAQGELVIADTDLAARQLIDLAMAGTFKRRLFGNMKQPMPADKLEKIVASAVAMFLKFYRT